MTDSMPDAKRKLPVLYVPTIDGAPDFDTQECDDGQTESLVVVFASDKYLERYNSDRVEAGYAPVEMAQYEPAVPRCATCNQVTRVFANRVEYRCRYGLPIMQDGSGYCWLHPEAQNG